MLLRLRSSAAALALAVLSACATAAGSTGPAPAPDPLRAAYEASIADAPVYRPEHVRSLKPVVADANGRVRVATLTAYTGYRRGADTLSREIWVTLVPEVRDSCAHFGEDALLRVRQLLGLPADYKATSFVEMSVEARSLFRPTADPATDRSLPCADTVPRDRCGDAFPADVPPEHVRWIANGTLGLWKIPGGFPWTRLGYTYNWRPGSPRYGASEYILRAGSPVEILSITPEAQYCAPATTPVMMQP